MTTILSVTCGSRLYGTHTSKSDYDVRQVFITPADQLLGLNPPDDTVHWEDPEQQIDGQSWELGKFLRMAMRGSFTALELLFAPESHVRHQTVEGRILRAHADLFLTEKVRTSLLGFTKSLSHELREDNDNFKPYLHAFRVLSTVERLYETGTLNFALPTAAAFRANVENAWSHRSFRPSLLENLAVRQARLAELAPRFPADVPFDVVNSLLLTLRGF